jgi:hypothetical protein
MANARILAPLLVLLVIAGVIGVLLAAQRREILDQPGKLQGAAVQESADLTAAPPAPAACPGGCTSFSCYRDRYDCMTRQQEPEAALADLKAAYDTSPVAKSQCHQLIHVIGRAAADKYPDISEAYRHGDHFCWSGYYHGVMERLISNARRDGKNLAEFMNSICQGVPGRERYSFDYYNCVHGLGHGIMYYSNYELFESLETCNDLEGQWEQASCWSGVFMENVIADGFEHSTDYLRPDEPLYPCNAVKDRYKTTCYLMQTSYMLAVTGRDFRKVFGLCTQAGEDYIDTCHQSLGRDASGQTVSDPERTKALCLLGADARQQSNCIIGAVKDFISYHHGTRQAAYLCTILPAELQKPCTDTVKSYGATL